jgi:hypothetical protein
MRKGKQKIEKKEIEKKREITYQTAAHPAQPSNQQTGPLSQPGTAS